MLKKKYYTGLQIHEAIDGVVGDYKKAIEIYRRLAKMETDDLVPVVRCKDCKHRPIDTGGHNYGQDLFFPDEDNVCPCQCGDQWYSWMPGDDWFCANGERVEQISAEFAKLMREGEIRVRWRDGET